MSCCIHSASGHHPHCPDAPDAPEHTCRSCQSTIDGEEHAAFYQDWLEGLDPDYPVNQQMLASCPDCDPYEWYGPDPNAAYKIARGE